MIKILMFIVFPISCLGQSLLSKDTIQYQAFSCENSDTTCNWMMTYKKHDVLFIYENNYAWYKRYRYSVKEDSFGQFSEPLLFPFMTRSGHTLYKNVKLQEGRFFYDLVYENYFTVKIASDTIFYGYDDGYKIQGILKPNIEYDMKYVPFLLKESLNTRSVDDSNALKNIKDTCKMMYIKLVDKKIHNHKYHCYYFQCKIPHDMPEWFVTKQIDIYVDTKTLLPVQTDYIYEDRVTRVSVW